MSTENRTFNTSRTTRRLLALLTGLTVWHLMSRFAWTMLAYPRSGSNMYSYYRVDPVKNYGQDTSWWDYFTGYTSKFGDIVSSHYYGYSLIVLVCIVIAVIVLVGSWVFSTNTGTDKRVGDLNFASTPAIVGLLIGMTAGPGMAIFMLAFT